MLLYDCQKYLLFRYFSGAYNLVSYFGLEYSICLCNLEASANIRAGKTKIRGRYFTALYCIAKDNLQFEMSCKAIVYTLCKHLIIIQIHTDVKYDERRTESLD